MSVTYKQQPRPQRCERPCKHRTRISSSDLRALGQQSTPPYYIPGGCWARAFAVLHCSRLDDDRVHVRIADDFGNKEFSVPTAAFEKYLGLD